MKTHAHSTIHIILTTEQGLKYYDGQ